MIDLTMLYDYDKEKLSFVGKSLWHKKPIFYYYKIFKTNTKKYTCRSERHRLCGYRTRPR